MSPEQSRADEDEIRRAERQEVHKRSRQATEEEIKQAERERHTTTRPEGDGDESERSEDDRS
jgi:hypothetical protein